ncbi:MAG: Holliday junction branch migration protein RuvA [Nitriliruptorales bacterium]|nr:Holliday junction branch migration protein RuvA [Nitriliruptorales bacterium]
MIAMLRGTVVGAAVGEVVLDVCGVGYQVHVPAGMSVPSPGRELTLHTHLAVREDALTLYGFTDAAGRALFTTLLSVTGVGPKLALAALGTLGSTGLRRAVVTEDVQALTVVPGLGKKSAQRLILELREKLGALAADGVPGAVAANGSGSSDVRTEVRQALAGLGYVSGEIAAAMERVPPADGEAAEELLRDALKMLAAR